VIVGVERKVIAKFKTKAVNDEKQSVEGKGRAKLSSEMTVVLDTAEK